MCAHYTCMSWTFRVIVILYDVCISLYSILNVYMCILSENNWYVISFACSNLKFEVINHSATIIRMYGHMFYCSILTMSSEVPCSHNVFRTLTVVLKVICHGNSQNQLFHGISIGLKLF